MDNIGKTNVFYKNHKFEDLTPEEFEKYCLQIANDWAKKNLKVGEYSIQYRKRNPIDIVISERKNEVSLPGQIIAQNRNDSKEHFIECKFYGRDLDLDVLGKSYVMTLRYRPKTLVIATKSDLSKSAIDFANWLTSQINDFACFLWSPDESIKLKNDSNNEPEKELTYQNKYNKPFIINNWELIEEDVFTSISLSSEKDITQNSHFIKSKYKYLFKANIKSLQVSRETKRVRLIFEFDDNRSPVENEINFKENIGGIISLTCELSRLNNESSVIQKAYLSITSSSGEDIIGIGNFPKLVIDPILSIKLNDFRFGEAEQFYLKWNQESTPILKVTGQGGVGKSFFCERVCQEFKNEGSNIIYSSISHESEATFITDILWVMLPSELRKLIQDKSNLRFKSEFITTFLEFELPDFTHEIKELQNLFLYNEWDNINIESIISTLIRLLSKSNQRVVLYLSDCHRLSTSLSSVLMSIISVLESKNWLHNKFRIILEYRSENNDITLSCSKLMIWTDVNLNSKITEIKLEPLSYEQLRNYIDKTLISSDNRAACKLLLKKSGGNPLYLRMLILNLLENSIFEYLNDGKLHVSSLAETRDFVVELTSNIQTILVRRLEFANSKLINNGIKNGLFIVVYNAISGLNISKNLIAHLSQQDEIDIHEGMIYLQEMELLKPNQSGDFDWAHEYIFEATKKWASIQENYFVKIDRATKLISPFDFSSSFLLARLEITLSRDNKAIDALNSAIQYAQQTFSKKYLCHLEILNVLRNKVLTPKFGALFLTNLEKLSRLSDYLISTNRVEEYNKMGVKALNHIEYMHAFEKKPFYRQYFHNLSHISISKLDFSQYLKCCKSTIKYCNVPVEYAQLLNRMVIYFRLTGNVRQGRIAAIIALQLQQIIDEKEDFDLESVIIGEITKLYWTALPEQSSILSNYLQECNASRRQSSHNLYIKACQELLLGNITESKQTKLQLDRIIKELELKSMESSVKNLTGIFQTLENDYESAYENFRDAFQSSIWLDSIKEELVFGNNLLLSMVMSNQLDGLEVLINRQFLICNKILNNLNDERIEKILIELQVLLERKFQIPKLNSTYENLLPNVEQNTNHICHEIIYNVLTILEITDISPISKLSNFNLETIPKNKSIGVLVPYKNRNLRLLI